MDKIVKLQSQKEAQGLFGAYDANIKGVEEKFKVKFTLRGGHLKISGSAANIKKASQSVDYLLEGLRSGSNAISSALSAGITRTSGGRQIGPKTIGQKEYVEAIKKYDIVFGVGPAGTGKTYLAMASAVANHRASPVRRVRPG